MIKTTCYNKNTVCSCDQENMKHHKSQSRQHVQQIIFYVLMIKTTCYNKNTVCSCDQENMKRHLSEKSSLEIIMRVSRIYFCPMPSSDKIIK